MAEYLIQGETLTAIADAIREKTGKTGTINPTEFSDNISTIVTAGESIDPNDIIMKTASRMVSPTLSYVPSSYFSGWGNLQYVSLPACTEVNNNAFYSCSNLQSISIQNCTSIGYNAFYSCSSLKEANFPVCTAINDAAFSGCSSLSSIAFPNCYDIGTYAFADCAMSTIELSSSYSNVKQGTFCNCSNLASINLASNTTTIAAHAFKGCTKLLEVNAPECQYLGTNAFYNANNVKLVYSKPMIGVGSNAFSINNKYVYESLFGSYYSDIMIKWSTNARSAAEGTKTIAGYVFGGTALNMNSYSKTLPTSLEYISPYAFFNQTGLNLSGVCPNLKIIGDYAFYSCNYNASIRISAPECNYIGNYAFYHGSNTSKGLKEIYAPKASYVGTSCFYGGSNLYFNVTLSPNVFVGSSAFYSCMKMAMNNTILSLTNSIIYPYTFANCRILSTTMSVNADVQSYAFASCMSLSTVIMNATQKRTISTSAFYYCSKLMSLYLFGSMCSLQNSSVFSCTPMVNSTYTGDFGSIFVPESLYSSYLTSTYWSTYSSRFVSMTDTEIQEVLDYWNGEINK